jgi:hypothetical protein
VLERIADASGTAAALSLWSLWQHYGTDGSALTVPSTSLRQPDPYHALTSTATYVDGTSPAHTDEIGYLLFPDLSVVVFRRIGADITFLPVVFRIPWILMTRHGAVRLYAAQGKYSVTLKLQSEPEDIALRSADIIRTQIAHEASAWANLIPRMPGLCAPTPETPNSNWPSFFPREVHSTKDLAAFEHQTVKLVRSVMAWKPGVFLQAQISAWSSRPLQGGIEPLRLTINWQKASGHHSCDTGKLKEHVLDQLFSAGTPWEVHDFPGCRIFFSAPDTACSDSLELFTHNIMPPQSNHERLKLVNAFPPPPG